MIDAPVEECTGAADLQHDAIMQAAVSNYFKGTFSLPSKWWSVQGCHVKLFHMDKLFGLADSEHPCIRLILHHL
jgi:hypothetical protein